jgi:predicted small lipoprotein YifL
MVRSDFIYRAEKHIQGNRITESEKETQESKGRIAVMNRGKRLGLLVSALFLMIMLGCGRKGPPSLPQKPNSSVQMASKEFPDCSDLLHTITPLNGCYTGCSFYKYPSPEGMIYANAIGKIRNPNIEIRNKFKYQMPSCRK